MTVPVTGLRRCFAAAALVLLSIPPTASGAGAQTRAEAADTTVLITGANRGIGLELAREYAAAGWRVIGTARKPDEATVLQTLGAEVVQLDVTDRDSVDRLAGDLRGRPIDLLINNAGIQLLMWKLEDVDIDKYNRILAVNTVGPVRVTLALLPNLRAGNRKLIVNVTSDISSIANNTNGGFYGYRESKAALNMFTRSLAAELGAEGFICIALHPGWVKTDMGGPKAPITVQESVHGILRVVDGLSSDDNGTFLTYAGERMAW
jgi:NAD(P)-dependent dehydrogenase (short-subunit alcohol dehydrogenase family)